MIRSGGETLAQGGSRCQAVVWEDIGGPADRTALGAGAPRGKLYDRECIAEETTLGPAGWAECAEMKMLDEPGAFLLCARTRKTSTHSEWGRPNGNQFL